MVEVVSCKIYVVTFKLLAAGCFVLFVRIVMLHFTSLYMEPLQHISSWSNGMHLENCVHPRGSWCCLCLCFYALPTSGAHLVEHFILKIHTVGKDAP